MNPKQLAFLGGCFRSTPAAERSQVQLRDFSSLYAQKVKKPCFPLAESPKTREMRFQDVS